MAIRLSNTCLNCNNLVAGDLCGIYQVQVTDRYTCDSFELKASLKDARNCDSCLRFEKEDCANPEKAAPTMLCASWAPRASA